MGEPLVISQSVLLPRLRFRDSTPRNRASFRPFRSELTGVSVGICAQRQRSSLSTIARVVSDSEARKVFNQSSDELKSAVQLDFGSGGGGEGRSGGKGGGGGGGGGDNSDDQGGQSESDNTKTAAMSMSQKLTLGYALLVGVGGFMGYLKSGSQKSLVSGGLSALVLFFVYTQLPTRPAFASAIGFGISAALLAVMGSRFKNSGKIFPAGVVSLVSLVMSGGYIHGIMRSLH